MAVVPEQDLEAVRARIATYYKKMDKVPPWQDDSGDDSDGSGKAAEDVPGDEGESEAPSAAEVRAALKTLQALVDAYEEPESSSTPDEDSEPPKHDDAEAEKAIRAELDAMKSL